LSNILVELELGFCGGEEKLKYLEKTLKARQELATNLTHI